jgi:hypothetical protein
MALAQAANFRAELSDAIGSSSVLLVVIGERWLEKKWLGKSKLSDVTDLVRLEIEWALRSRITIIPVVVGDAKMPRPAQLPASLVGLSRLQGMHVDEGKDLHNHMYRLILVLKELQQKEFLRTS